MGSSARSLPDGWRLLVLIVNVYYPTANHEALHTICDLSNAGFLLDDMTEEQSGEDSAKSMQEYLDGLTGIQRAGSDIDFAYNLSPLAHKLDIPA
ncbi:hypothetical protein OE88DRAFT_1668844 [Heliocybe sulcata]|uniref:Uncharacterized protein n=1 Tax=Heliocybe sulcata TaxID=5364 RepID=A0A5C3MKG0_9AGAM|nr:hypothetical protein OE88DRAFT_1668844 [Heliocybe sulcata]